MTEGQYQALRDEMMRAISNHPLDDGAATDAALKVVERELAARDAVIEQIRAQAGEWRSNSRRCNRCANDLERVLSALPSTGETNNG